MTDKQEEKYDVIPVPEDLKDRMLGLVDSEYTRKYLEESGDFNIHHWVELVISAPKPMDLKIELLRELQAFDMNSKSRDHLDRSIDAAETAMDRLYNMDPERSVLSLTYFDAAYPDPRIMGTSRPVRSYEEALRDIWYNFYDDDDKDEGCLEDESDLHDFYMMLELYDVADGNYEEQIHYFCAPNGKVHYIRKENLSFPSMKRHDVSEWEEALSGDDGLIYWETPYEPGDILYIDMRPWYKPTYCLVYWVNKEMPWDCCGVQCIYPVPGGMAESGALKHSHGLPCLVELPNSLSRPFFSPMYRAERYDGELPEEYAFMKPLSEKLKSDPAASQKLDAFLMDFSSEDRQHLSYAYRPTLVKEPDNWPDEPDLDVLWHPDWEERQWWEETGQAEGVKKERLLEAAGVDKKKKG